MRNADTILLAALVAIGAAGCGRGGSPPERLIPVRTRVVEITPISQTAVVPCRLEGVDEAVLSVSAPATVTGVFVREGDSVEEGDILVALETDGMHQAEIEAAAARMTAAGAAMDYQMSRLERAGSLFESGAVPQSVYEEAQAAAQSSSASAALAEVGYSQSLSEASLGQVRAPFAGTVTRVWARQGNPASGSLVAMTGGSMLQTTLELAPSTHGLLSPGLPVFLETPLFPGEIFAGTISSVSPSIDPVSGLATAVAQFSDSGGRLRPGMACSATVALQTEAGAVVVPQWAMEKTPEGLWRVAVVEGGRARFRIVEVGIRNGFRWQVTSGLSAGDTLVLLGVNTVTEGCRVREAGE